jgi:dTDP-4-dehydrorhamnose reductase
MRILVVGASGLVGSNVAGVARDRGHTVLGTHRSVETADLHLDKTDQSRTIEVITDFDPDAVVDTAAFHAVDDCKTRRDRAWRVNAEGTANVARAAEEVDAHVVYLSTDYVFPGDPADAPYAETDPVSPVNYYACAKLAGETAACVADERAILRSSVVYGTARDNFATWALDELAAGNEIDVVTDQVSRPTYAPDLARACVEVLERGLTGLYHATGPESVSRYEFTRRLADAYGHDRELVRPIATEQFGQEAPRPADGSLDSTRLYGAIADEFRAVGEGIGAMRERDRE